MKKHTVLFVCIGNSIRSQMAEGLMRHLAGDRVTSFSAGLSPGVLHPMAIRVMEEKGIDISSQKSKSVEDIDLTQIDQVMTLCSEADVMCPTLPKHIAVLKWPFEDPCRAVGSAKLDMFRRVRDGIEANIKAYLKEIV